MSVDDSSPTEAHLRAAPPAASNQRALLVMSPRGVFTHPLPQMGSLAIGRGAACEVCIDDVKASRRHAVLHVGDVCTIEDAGSMNGTMVGDRRLPPNARVALRAGEYVTVGSTVLAVQNTAAPPARVWSDEAFASRLKGEHLRATATNSTFGLLLVDLARSPEMSDAESTSSSRSTNPASRAERIEQIFREGLRPTDVVGSTAPGRFEVLLVETPPGEVEGIAARIDRELHDADIAHEIRIACFPRDGVTRESLRSKAEALSAEDEPPPSIAVGGGVLRKLSPLVERVAAGEINVLILGETGVGKEVLAREIHMRSARSAHPLVSLNCAALSESLLESELFGHEKGAFTGAIAAKPGLLESAEGGTVFLDEVGEMPLSLQAKLLRVLEQREVQRVGSLRPRAIDVRFLAATNRDLESEITAGRFRQDLYFRLNGISIVIPPLRDRLDELEALARSFIAQACERSRRVVQRMSPQVVELLRRHAWPGNVRELRNVIERAVLLSPGDAITLESFPTSMLGGALQAFGSAAPAALPPNLTSPPPRPAFDPDVTAQFSAPKLDELILPDGDERTRIIAALRVCDGNQTRAAKILGISRRTLVTRLDEYDLPRPRKRSDDEP